MFLLYSSTKQVFQGLQQRYLEKNLNASRPSEHPPVTGGGNVAGHGSTYERKDKAASQPNRGSVVVVCSGSTVVYLDIYPGYSRCHLHALSFSLSVYLHVSPAKNTVFAPCFRGEFSASR